MENHNTSTGLPDADTMSLGQGIRNWMQLSRIPFHTVGLLPFALGAVLAWRATGTFNWPVFGWSSLAVSLIMLCTYYLGEYYDLRGDRLSAQMERNSFSGGTQVLVHGLLPRSKVRIAGYAALTLAAMIGLLLQFYYETGVWTIPLGAVGMVAGFFYSTPPLRWVKRGVGEILIGFCYGWLPVACSYYLQAGRIDPIVHWISIPIACTIFNVILVNEFPDYPADVIEGKRNLVVRLGKGPAALLYITMMTLAWIAFALAVKQGLPPVTLLFYLPVFLVTLALTVMMSKKDYMNKARLQRICGLTISVNLGSAMAPILALWLGGS